MAALAPAVTCQMRHTPAGVPAQRGSMPQQLPLLKPLGARHQLPRLFSAVGRQLDTASPAFVRPDVPPDFDDEPPSVWAKLRARRIPPQGPWSGNGSGKAKSGADNKPRFRSALEQASWLSSEAEAGRRAEAPRSGLLGLGFLGL